jgi:peptide/nickel transport system substrate-binding protein
MTENDTNGRLVIGVHYEPSNVDPHIGAAELALQMTNGIFDTLVNKTPDGDYLPGLAQSFEVSADECAYTFQLREDVKFHDGTTFDAAAVKFSLDRAHNPANHSQLAGRMLGPYANSRVLSDHAVEIRLSHPYGLLLDSLSQGWLAPVSPLAVAKYGSDFARHPVGTGPFVFSDWIAGERITIKRNPDYAWAPPMVQNQGPAYLDEIVFVFLPDNADRTAALRAGEVDAVFYVSPTDIAGLRSDPAFRVDTWPIRGIPVCMMMNTARQPTDDLLVRQAVNYAVDQDALVAEVFKGEFARAYGPVSQFTLGYDDSVEAMYPYDLAAAKRLLEEAGWEESDGGIRVKQGEMLRLKFYALPVNFYPQFGEIVTQQLRQVGIEVVVSEVPPVEWIKAGMRGDHHLIPQGKYASSSQLLSFVYHSRQSDESGYGWSKRSAGHCPGFDELLDRAEQTLRKEDYVPMFEEVQRTVMKEALVAPLHCNTNVIAYRANINHIKFDAIGAYPYFHDTVINRP